MVSVITLALITLVVTVIGGGAGYIIWLKTRPKKIAWIAKCYQVGEGVRDVTKDDKGNKIDQGYRLNDLIPYMEDVLERTDQDHGITIYKLNKLNISTSAVTADHVEIWGKGRKEVAVLIKNDSATLLKKGYDKISGEVIFQPMTRERIELIKSELSIKKDRLRKEKNVLQAITPWIVAGICMLGLVAIAYLMGEAFIESSDRAAVAHEKAGEYSVEATENIREAMTSPEIREILEERKEAEKPPPIE